MGPLVACFSLRGSAPGPFARLGGTILPFSPRHGHLRSLKRAGRFTEGFDEGAFLSRSNPAKMAGNT